MSPMTPMRRKELRILIPTTPKPTWEQFMRVAQVSSLLQVTNGMKAKVNPRHLDGADVLVHRDGAEALVQELSASLVDISAAEDEAVAILKASFAEQYAAGQHLTTSLLQAQAVLNKTENDLLSRQAELESARRHLIRTQSRMHNGFFAVRLFANKVVEASSGPPLISNATASNHAVSMTTRSTTTSTSTTTVAPPRTTMTTSATTAVEVARVTKPARGDVRKEAGKDTLLEHKGAAEARRSDTHHEQFVKDATNASPKRKKVSALLAQASTSLRLAKKSEVVAGTVAGSKSKATADSQATSWKAWFSSWR